MRKGMAMAAEARVANRPIDDALRAQVQLLDLGSGNRAGSLTNAELRFATTGIGLEVRAAAVARAQAAGHAVFEADIRDLEPDDFPAVRYVNIDNVLEHLPDLDAVASVLERACRLASRMVHVRHPSFEDEDYLAGLGLKEYWTDWPDSHTAHVRLHEFVRIANEAGVYRLVILPVCRLLDSADPAILPLDAPPDQGQHGGGLRTVYVESEHGPKPQVTFDRPVYYAYDLLFLTGEEIPTIRYRNDPETRGHRPAFAWSDTPLDALPPWWSKAPVRGAR
jgi:hypothetical protein